MDALCHGMQNVKVVDERHLDNAPVLSVQGVYYSCPVLQQGRRMTISAFPFCFPFYSAAYGCRVSHLLMFYLFGIMRVVYLCMLFSLHVHMNL